MGALLGGLIAALLLCAGLWSVFFGVVGVYLARRRGMSAWSGALLGVVFGPFGLASIFVIAAFRARQVRRSVDDRVGRTPWSATTPPAGGGTIDLTAPAFQSRDLDRRDSTVDLGAPDF